MSDNSEIDTQNSKENKKDLTKILEMIKKGHAEWGGQKLIDRKPVVITPE